MEVPMLAHTLSSFQVLSKSRSQALLLAAALAFAPMAVIAAPAGDVTDAQVEVENAKNSFPGIVNAPAVFARCGPADSYYPTVKLEKGDKVTVVGIKLEWLKIVPPTGSFCYISKAFVDRTGDGTSGKVNKDGVNVRAGSTQNMLKVVPLCTLATGEDVKIIGDQDEYYKIVPPAGKAFVYINRQYVDPDPAGKPDPLDKTAAKLEEPKPSTSTEKPTRIARGSGTEMKTSPLGEGSEGGSPTTTKTASTLPTEAVASTKPSDDVVAIETMYDKAEAEFAATAGKPLDQQPIAALAAQYQTLVASDKLAPTLHRIAESRAATLKLRAAAAGEMAAAKAAQEALSKRQMALQAERKELEEQLAAKGVASYTAVGELQSSSLQQGAKILYRLTDPANGRTVCYIRTDDGKFLTMMGKFIGVHGELSTDPQLSVKVIAPTDVSPVDAAKVNHGVTATVIPPSMLVNEEATAASHVEGRQ
jgi:uncharacterized protein YgiM (DUF1202 family)